jgi:hypothetical protein
VARATRELRALAPDVTILTQGSAEEMVANSSVLVVQYSTLAFVGLALGKDVHAKYSVEELRRLLPLQNGGTSGAAIARVCREVFASRKRRGSVTKTPRAESVHEANP